jgi:hypothetical protein
MRQLHPHFNLVTQRVFSQTIYIIDVSHDELGVFSISFCILITLLSFYNDPRRSHKYYQYISPYTFLANVTFPLCRSLA